MYEMAGDMTQLNQSITRDWFLHDQLRTLVRSLSLAKRVPPIIRVQRRGFPRETRRGFDVWRTDGIYRVVRRSNWNLWLEKVRERDGTLLVGTTVQVRTPRRYGPFTQR